MGERQYPARCQKGRETFRRVKPDRKISSRANQGGEPVEGFPRRFGVM